MLYFHTSFVLSGERAFAPASLPFLFAMPASWLTFKRESGPGYGMPHQWRRSHADGPCISGWHTLLLTSRLCWCQLALSAGEPGRSSKSLSLSSRLFLPTCTGIGLRLQAWQQTHLPPSLSTNTYTCICASHAALTMGALSHDRGKCAPLPPHAHTFKFNLVHC